jgi:hypothetical protein
VTTVHVLPVDDLIAHESDSDDCPCGPNVQPYEAEDGSISWLVVHHALDRREERE